MENIRLITDMNQPLQDTVYQTLHQAILRGKASPGEHLRELSLCEMLGVSRSPVREALRKLERDGLVQILPNRGAVVSTPDRLQLKELCEMWEALEAFCIRRIMEAETGEKTGQGRIRYGAEKQGTEAGRAGTANQPGIEKSMTEADLDEAFHLEFARFSGNQMMDRAMREIQDRLYRFRLFIYADQEVCEKNRNAHEELLQEIRSGNLSGALALLHRHISDFSELFR